MAGHGLVYNMGERVEGYTNLLWTLLIAAAMALGIPPETSSKVLGIAAWLALVAVLARRSWRPARPRPFVPLAAALVLLMEDYQTWATGGLETSLFTLLVVAGLLLATRANAGVRGLVLAAVVLAAAVATRPDGAIFAAVAVVATCWAQAGAMPPPPGPRRGHRDPARTRGHGARRVEARVLRRPLPHRVLLQVCPRSLSRPGLVLHLPVPREELVHRPLALLSRVVVRPDGPSRARHVVLLLAGGLFLACVAHSGGDFMFARRVLPAMPLLFIVLEDWLAALPGRLLPATAVVLVAVGIAVPYPLYARPGERLSGIADEPAFYPPALMEARRVQALVAAQALAGLPVRAAYEGGMCVFGYYSRLPYLAEMTGLTQYSLAKTPLVSRGHVGHEKTASDEWLTENNIHFVFSQVPPPVSRGGPLRVDEIAFGDALKARIWIYDEAIMAAAHESTRYVHAHRDHAARSAAPYRRRVLRGGSARLRGARTVLLPRGGAGKAAARRGAASSGRGPPLATRRVESSPCPTTPTPSSRS